MKYGKLIKDRYFHDDNESGLYFDLYPIKRGGGDESIFNNNVGVANMYLDSIMPADKVWRCTLFLLDDQIANLSPEWKNILAPKTYLMTFRPGVEVGSYDVHPWSAYGNDSFLWSSPDKVYTKYDSNALSHRFRLVDKKEVDDYLADNTPITPPINIPIVSPSVPKKWKISLLGGLISGTITAVEE